MRSARAQTLQKHTCGAGHAVAIADRIAGVGAAIDEYSRGPVVVRCKFLQCEISAFGPSYTT